jgi:hypothetical protein
MMEKDCKEYAMGQVLSCCDDAEKAVNSVDGWVCGADIRLGERTDIYAEMARVMGALHDLRVVARDIKSRGTA